MTWPVASRACVFLLAFVAALAPADARAQAAGGACTGAAIAALQANGNNLYCNSSVWTYPAYQFGVATVSSGSCSSTTAGEVQWTGSALEYCNGSTWTTIAGGITGSGTTNYLARWTPNGTTLGIGTTYDNGTNVGIGTTSPVSILHIQNNSTPPELTIASSYGSNYDAGAVVLESQTIASDRGLGTFMYDTTGQDEWFAGRPYNLQPNSYNDAYVIIRQSGISAHSRSTSDPTANPPFLVIKNSGNVGIGTTAPAQILDVREAANQRIGFVANTNGAYSGAPGIMAANDAYTAYEPMGFAASQFYFNANIGIGTTSASSALTIWGGGVSMLNAGAGTGGDWTLVQNTGGTLYSGVLSSTGGGLTNGLNYAGAIATGGATPLQFGTNGTVYLTMSSTGYVGIGTTGPQGMLDIERTANDSGTILQLGDGNTTAVYDFARNSTTGALSIQGIQSGYNNIVLAPTGGNVGIGSTSPGATLTVAGTEALNFNTTNLTTTGTQSDVAIGTNSTVRYTGSAIATFNGIVAGVPGQILYLHNGSTYALTLANLSASESTVANQIVTGTGSNLTVAANSAVTLQYDNTAANTSGATGAWRVIGAPSSLSGGTANYDAMWTSSTALGTGAIYDTGSSIGIGTASPQSMIEAFNGEIQPGSSGASCTSANAGAIRFDGTFLRLCNGTSSTWQIVTSAAPSPIVTFITSSTSWTVPRDWNASNNTIEVIGGGGGGGAGYQGPSEGGGGGGCGGGGAYAKIINASLTAGASVTIAIGTGGAATYAGGDTYVCSSTSNCSSISGSAVVVGAKGGGAGGNATNYYTMSGAGGVGAGGLASSSVGTTKYSGGTSTQTPNGSTGGCGGGGAAGPYGAGANGAAGSGTYSGGGGGGADYGAAASTTTGGNGRGGSGGGTGANPANVGTNGGGGGGAIGDAVGNLNGGTGGQDVVWTQTTNSASAGPGGGGGGGGYYSSSVSSNAGGSSNGYGGGGGGGGGGYSSIPGGTGAAGNSGIIVITYTPL
jgi:hypothetical protein